MVPAHSIKVSRVSMYSGYRHVNSSFAYGAFTLFGRLSQNLSARLIESILQSEPRIARNPVWPLSRSLAATYEIDVSFSSSGYLDVSVHRVPSVHLWIQCTVTGVLPAGFPHSDICGSMDICSSPQLFAAYHVFLRLLVPRHPPCALLRLTSSIVIALTMSVLHVYMLFRFFRISSFLGCLDILGFYLSIDSYHQFCMKFSRYVSADLSLDLSALTDPYQSLETPAPGTSNH